MAAGSKDTGGGWKTVSGRGKSSSSPGGASLLTSLRRYSSSKVSIPRTEQEKARNLVHAKIENLLKFLKENDKAFCSFDYQGSAYDGLKVGQADEFDVMVALNGKSDIEPIPVVPGYALMQPIKKDDFRFKKYVTDDGYMSGVQFRQKNFFSMVHKWSNTGQEDDGIKLKISAHGPAVQVDLTPPRSTGLACDISVDLVPTLRIREDAHYVAKPYKSYAEIHTPLPCDSQLLWRQSFSKSERAILKKIDGDGGCRKDCCRILKSIRNEDPTLRALTSYHLKTALLHECDIVKDWDKNKLDQRFLGMLGSLAKYSREKSLPHYFVPELNLMEGYKNSTLDNIHGRLSRLQNSPLERSKLLSPTEIKNK